MKTHTDQKYVDALLNHDSSLIEDIYKKCSVQCIKFVRQNSGTLSESKDIFQESLATLYKQAKSGLVLTVPICAYLYPIYKGKWFNLLKRKKIKSGLSDLRNYANVGYNNVATHPAEDSSTEEIQDKIFMDCFEKLSIDVKKLFNLRYKSNLSSKEIAQLLGIDDNTVNQRFSYYKQKLKECAEQHPDFKELKQ